MLLILLLLKVITGLLVMKHFHFSLNLEKILVLIFFFEWKTKKFWNSFQHNNSRFLWTIDYHHTKGNFAIAFNMITQGFFLTIDYHHIEI